MNAVLSGRAGIAVIRDGERCLCLDYGVGNWVEYPPEEDTWHIFGECRDFEFLEQINLELVQARLKGAVREADALDLTLTLLDTCSYADDTLTTAAEELEEHLTPDVQTAIKKILFACPLPEKVNTDRAFSFVQSFPKAKAFLAKLLDLQPSIHVVHDAWLSVPLSTFAEPTDREVFRHYLMRQGVFRDSVLAHHEEKAVGAVIMLALKLNQIEKLRNHRAVLAQWAKPFKVATPTIRSEREDGAAKFEQKKDRKAYDRNAAYDNVRKQVKFVAKQIQAGSIDLARKLVGELIESQLKHSDGYKFAVKSLDDLANIAQNPANWPFNWNCPIAQPSCTMTTPTCGLTMLRALQDVGRHTEAVAAYDQAIKVDPHDVVARNGRADVLKAMGRLDESLTAYETTLRDHPQSVVAKTGRAEVLKAMGRLDESLTAYETTLRDHPQSVVAKSGRAEVLKAMGRFDESLDAYERILRDHPEEVFAKTGRAEVLKAMGRFDESLDAYDTTLRDHPQEVVVKNGRAEVLKAMNRFEEALQAYQATRQEHPENAFAMTGMASVLLCMGRATEALELLPEQKLLDSHEWVGLHIRGMALLKLRQVPEAIAIFERGLHSSPFSQDKSYSQSALAIARVRMKEYQEAVNVLDQGIGLPQSRGLFQALRVHAFSRLGNAKKASEFFAVLPLSHLDIERRLFRTLDERFITGTFPSDSDDDLINIKIEYALQAA